MARPRKYDPRKISLSYTLGAIRKIKEEGQKFVVIEKGDIAIRYNPNAMAWNLIINALAFLGWKEGGKYLIYSADMIPFTEEKLKKIGLDLWELYKSKTSASESKSSEAEE